MTRSTALDKDLKKFSQLDKARSRLDRQYLRLTLAAAFLLAILFVMTIGQGSGTTNMLVAAAAVIGGYMAMNIGANDVANNVGAAVGSGALTLGAALMIAAVMEVAGAMIAGADVVRTVSEGIIDPALIGEPRVFVWAMMASLLAAAVWVNLATWLSAPVSTTHSIVGGVVGAGIAAAGTDAVDWNTMTRVIASWVISPVMGGLIAAALLAAVEFLVISRDDKVAAARRWV
ncbi:MAG TPA: anion permease, partial [Alphaproteobacteria bacterium]|nr:anion permease [Alphaproteobacteria bacterium]